MRRGGNGDMVNNDILALHRHEMETGRVSERDALDTDVLTAVENDQAGAGKSVTGRFAPGCFGWNPPAPTRAVYRALTGDGDIGQRLRVDECAEASGGRDLSIRL